MDNLLNNLGLTDFNNGIGNCDSLDINKILIILLLLTGKLTIESITVFPNDFAVTLGTFNIT